MTFLHMPTPSPLQQRSHVLFADEDAAECFMTFFKWAEKIAAQSALELPDLGTFYLDFRVGDEGIDRPRAPIDTSAPFEAAWIDPSCYIASRELLDGFFSDKHPWAKVIERTSIQRGEWSELARSMRGDSGIFDVAAASARMIRERIEVHRASKGIFMHSQGYDGRHRMMAMIALGAPSLPVLLRL